MRRPTPLLAAGAAALALAAAPAPSHASPKQFTIFEPSRELLTGSAAQRENTLDEIAAFGVSRVRVLVYWNNVVASNDAKTKPGSLDETDPTSRGYDWSVYDAVFAAANARDIEVIPTLTGPVPRWATAGKRDHLTKPDQRAFGRWVQAAGTRYGDFVETWSIWNEPNQPQFLLPQYVKGKPFSPGYYRGLYEAAAKGLAKSGNGGDVVLAGETSPRGNDNVVAPVTFVKRFFKGRRIKVDGWAHHPYTTREGPFFKPKAVDVTIGVLARLVKALDASTGGRPPVYVTEFGIQSKPDPYYGVSEARQNEYRAISEKIAYDNPRVRAFSQYLMRDDLPRSGGDRFGGFESGLRFANGRKKLAYDGFRLPVVADQRGKRKVALWGLVRPASGATQVTVESRDKGAKGFKRVATVKTNGRGVWKRSAAYRDGRLFRVRWKGSVSPPVHAYRAP